MNLVSVYLAPGAYDVLYQLLLERHPHECISHKGAPSFEEHRAFVSSRPYAAWYIAEEGGKSVGACYLTKNREIGVWVLKAYRGMGYAFEAVEELLRLHPGRALANINPANEASIALFERLGFRGPIQLTLERSS